MTDIPEKKVYAFRMLLRLFAALASLTALWWLIASPASAWRDSAILMIIGFCMIFAAIRIRLSHEAELATIKSEEERLMWRQEYIPIDSLVGILGVILILDSIAGFFLN